MLSKTKFEMTEKAKQEAKVFFDLFEVCEGFNNSTIDLLSSKKENDHQQTFILRKGNESYFIQKFVDDKVSPTHLTMDNCTYINQKLVINNHNYSKRTMTIYDEYVNVNLQDKKNNLNEVLEFNVGLNYSGEILYSHIRRQEMLFIPEKKSISHDMIHKITSNVIPFSRNR